MRLTKLETEMLNHRLHLPDCIAEAIEHDQEVVGGLCDIMLGGDYARAIEINPTVAKAILQDAIDGNTWLSAVFSEGSPQKYASHEKAANSLAEKISALIGKPVAFGYTPIEESDNNPSIPEQSSFRQDILDATVRNIGLSNVLVGCKKTNVVNVKA